MRWVRRGGLAAAAGLLATQAFAIEVERTRAIAAPPERVWAVIGPFCGIAEWHPGVAACAETEADGVRGRVLTLGDGGIITERLEALDEAGMRYSYAVLDAPLPVVNYRATLAVMPAGEGARVVWTSEFDAAEGTSEADAAGLIAGIYQAGLDGIEAQSTR